MKLAFAAAPARSWETSHAYRSQINNGTVRSVSHYDYFYEAYRNRMKDVTEAADIAGMKPQSAMLCGPGSSYEEALLVKESFPAVERIHFVDWHLPNLELLQRLLEINGSLLPDVKLSLQHSDLRSLDKNEAFPVDFAYISKVFDLFEGFGQWQILKSISDALAPGGILYSLDYPFSLDNRDFNDLAGSAGLREIRTRIYQKS